MEAQRAALVRQMTTPLSPLEVAQRQVSHLQTEVKRLEHENKQVYLGIGCD